MQQTLKILTLGLGQQQRIEHKTLTLITDVVLAALTRPRGSAGSQCP
ncbi:MAG TPA: hypothetical protein VHW06_08920 [Streptosporangiaceae bacterium]|nr:hypothetical protein [Streptosporangiaceae bacterium]